MSNIFGVTWPVFTRATDDRLYQMSHSAKIVSAIFYEHALAAILAVSVIHAMKREQSRILVVSAILAVSVARVIWRDSLAKIADTKIIGIDTQWDIWYNLSSVPGPLLLCFPNLVPRACNPREGTWGSGIIRFREESDWPLIWNAQFNLSQDSWLLATDYPRASRSFPRIAGSGNEIVASRTRASEPRKGPGYEVVQTWGPRIGWRSVTSGSGFTFAHYRCVIQSYFRSVVTIHYWPRHLIDRLGHT